ncbi:MAG: hypothetical protein AAFQ94_01460 [Bacteroidota bacterium]
MDETTYYMLMTTFQHETRNKFIYSFQFRHEGNEVYLDHDRGNVKIVWDGRINKEAAADILSYAADLVEGGLVSTILLDRQKLIHFEAAARKWIKEDFFSIRCKELSHLIKRVAIVNETSLAASIYGKKIINDIEHTFSELPIKKFDKIEEAENWLLNI